MKKIICFGLFLLGYVSSFSQAVSPESIVWNTFTETYIISDTETGKLVSMDKNGKYSDFTTGLNHPKGLLIDMLSIWVTDVTEIVEIDAENGEIIDKYPIPGSGSLNDIVSDDINYYLYITDTQNSRIFKFDRLTLTSAVFSKGLIPYANGIIFDPLGGLIVVSFDISNARIFSVDIEEGNVEVLAQTQFGQLDGIAYDTKRDRYYISSWETGSIYVFDPSFEESPELLQSSLSNPADIYYDEITDSLIVPIWNSGLIVFIGFESTGVKDTPDISDFFIYPNPVKEHLFFSRDFSGTTLCEIYNSIGTRVIKSQINKNGIDVSELSPGIYHVKLEINGEIKIFRFIKE